MQPHTAEIAAVFDADARPKPAGKVRLKTLRALDGRTVAARRAAALAEMFAVELGGQLTEAQLVAVQNAAALQAIAEDCQMRRLAGDTDVSLDDLVRAVSAARRAARDLGIINHKAREPAAGLTLEKYLAEKRRAGAEA
jgi:hypothetical protein